MVVAVIVIATLQGQAVVLVIGNGGGGQSTLPANQGDQRGAGHSMMQGGGGGSNLSCQLLQAASRATPTQVTRPRQQACSQAVGDVAKGNTGYPCQINIVDSNDHSHTMRPQRIHHSEDDGDCDSNSANDAVVDDDSDDGGKQQRKQVQQQHSSPASKTTRFATTLMRARAPPFVPKSQHEPGGRTVLTATAHPQ